ncbi:MAG TPA: ATP-binding protein [Ramlibacter sp.]|uniref:ATP-binding protein n=1 Tax=Ramlibacter sp. TaxID=1917967 RepID=UPI002CDF77EA|nr:ATP-binding protein [Ramlibacter sp.]HVZ46297.1 ATP-binding protein [Ramlibacter sp.]
MKISLLGAESTGKTTLALALRKHFDSRGRKAAVVSEVLREWCAREGRTPRPHEQLPIAREQEARVDAAATRSQVVIGDTSALMVAIYSAMLFEDGSLYRFGVEQQKRYDFTLVTGLDLPWVADGLQRDGPHVREPVDALVREALDKAGIAYRVVYGEGEERLANALAALGELERAMPQRPWRWTCEKCGDPDCEHRLFTGMIRQ